MHTVQPTADTRHTLQADLSEGAQGFVVLNPAAGGADPMALRATLQAVLGAERYDLYETTGDETLRDVVATAVNDHPYAWVAAVGGDGTVSQVAEGLVDTAVPLAIIPAGTGNALAQEFDIPRDPEAACRLLTRPTATRSVDAIRVGPNYYFLQVGVGVESVTMKNTSSAQKNRWGPLAYLWTAAKEAIGWQPARFRLSVDGVTHTMRASEIVIANARSIGVFGLNWRDTIAPDDGRIDIAVVQARSLLDYARVAWALVRGRQASTDHLHFFTAQDAVRLETDRPLPVHGDGEVLDSGLPFAAEVVTGAIRVIVPDVGETVALPSAQDPVRETSATTETKAFREPAQHGPGVLRYLFVQAFKEWREDHASRLAAGLSYYTAFSLPPILVIVLAVVGRFYDRQAVEERILAQVGELMGESGSDLIRLILENAQEPTTGSIAAIVSLVLLALGASGVFVQLQDAMDTIWEVAPRPNAGLLETIKTRFLSFTMVLTVGFLLLVSLVLSAALSAVSDLLSGFAAEAIVLARVLSFLVSFVGVTFLFALIFKVIPDARVRWRDVWIGALVTAVLFNIGKWAIGLYLGQSAPASAYGAAGSLIVFLLWVYYSAQILFFGAEFTQVYANRFGARIVPEGVNDPQAAAPGKG